MYKRLTKRIEIEDGKECVTCINYGTEKCPVHTGEVSNCLCCPTLGAVFNQLYLFEEVMQEEISKK